MSLWTTGPWKISFREKNGWTNILPRPFSPARYNHNMKEWTLNNTVLNLLLSNNSDRINDSFALYTLLKKNHTPTAPWRLLSGSGIHHCFTYSSHGFTHVFYHGCPLPTDIIADPTDLTTDLTDLTTDTTDTTTDTTDIATDISTDTTESWRDRGITAEIAAVA